MYEITLRPLADAVPAVIRLRRALKMLLRAYGLRCERAREVEREAK